VALKHHGSFAQSRTGKKADSQEKSRKAAPREPADIWRFSPATDEMLFGVLAECWQQST